jgi:hypothetical protein
VSLPARHARAEAPTLPDPGKRRDRARAGRAARPRPVYRFTPIPPERPDPNAADALLDWLAARVR